MNHKETIIQNYNELVAERHRLEQLIDNQKNIIRHDLDELKAEFKKEIRPAIEAAGFIKKIAKPETRNETLFNIGANLAIDLLLKRMLRKSNVVFQVLLPRIIKNYSTHLIYNIRSRSNGNGQALTNQSIQKRY